ncbi:hypothetical protein KI809_17025 [Geobacter pelophilus]|uniref:Uncharacterized protein n=1 Tax=Geoanaerobacter pelophilus TaxID=60036 RepID=A0AAW4L776_9BACT|nr:hypothetical protein [Geoanaerobacter pelophilus]MBT0666017.1 hypothetical protein [Geoanaerobacter pelophilus]
MKRSFIARQYTSHGMGRSYYEEAIFETYEAANSFIQEISEEDDDCFLSEIVSYPTNSTEPWDDTQIWTFDRKGSLLHFYDARKEEAECKVIEEDGCKIILREPRPQTYTGKYEVGNIVIIRAFPWNEVSPVTEDTIGVIATTPNHFEEWLSKGKDRYDWDNSYVVYCIRSGYVDHIHVEERGIELYTNEVPERLTFLDDLAEYFRGKEILKKEVMEEVFAGNIFVEKVRRLKKSDYCT